MELSRIATAVVTLALGVQAVADDVQVGATKSAGMASAGLALRSNKGGGDPRNPAMYAFSQRFRVTDLNFGTHARGLSLRRGGELLGKLSDGGLDTDKLVEIAREFGDDRVSFGSRVSLGLASSGFNLGLEGLGMVDSVPNAALRQWVRNGADLNAPDPAMRLDGYGYAHGFVSVGYGRTLPARDGSEMAVGVDVKFVEAYYSHHRVDAAQIVSGTATNTGAPEMLGEDVLKRRGVAADFGWYMATGPEKRLEVAAVIRNLARPDTGFTGTLPGSDAPNRTDIEPFERSLAVGFGYTHKAGAQGAFDVVGIGGRRAEVRLGVDVPFGRLFSARAGYGSRGGLTAGLSVAGITLSVGTANAFQAGTFFRF